jgi:excisionase family DNA binding protein
MAREEELLTTQQACAKLKISRATLMRYIKKGRVQPIKLGRDWRFPWPGTLKQIQKGQR